MLDRRRSFRLAVSLVLAALSVVVPVVWKAAGGDPGAASGSLIELVRFVSAGSMLGAFWAGASVAFRRLSELLQTLVATGVYLLVGFLLWWFAYDVPLEWKHAFNLVVLWPTEFALRTLT